MALVKVRPFRNSGRNVNRWQAHCEECGWYGVATGLKAEETATRWGRRHVCRPSHIKDRPFGHLHEH